jgi:hypothetical protein
MNELEDSRPPGQTFELLFDHFNGRQSTLPEKMPFAGRLLFDSKEERAFKCSALRGMELKKQPLWAGVRGLSCV